MQTMPSNLRVALFHGKAGTGRKAELITRFRTQAKKIGYTYTFNQQDEADHSQHEPEHPFALTGERGCLHRLHPNPPALIAVDRNCTYIRLRLPDTDARLETPYYVHPTI